MSKIISKLVDWIFNVLVSLSRGIGFLFSGVNKSVNMLFNFVYQACDQFIRNIIKGIRESKNPYVKRFFSATTFYLGILILLIIFFFDVVLQIFYVVNLGSSGVVLNFGKYSRTATPGLNFKIPYIERVYIVNTGNLLQESIGFRIVPKTDFAIKSPEELAADSYIRAREGLLNSGNALTEINRGGNLNKDYLIDPLLKKVRTSRNEVTQKRSIPSREAAEEAMGFPKNGRAPIKEESQMLSGNLNLIEVTWVVQYEISDPRKYLFNSTNVRENIRNVTIAAMKQAVGDGLDFEILSTGREKIESEALAITKKLLSEMDIGINVVFTFIIQTVPPEQVKSAYDGVSIARQEMESKMLEAQVRYNQIIPEAKGEAEKIVYKAKAYVSAIRNQAEGEAERFRLVLEEYNKEKEATWDRLYIEGMQHAFTEGKITVLDPTIKGILPVFANRDPNPKNTGPISQLEQRIKTEIYAAAIKATSAAPASAPAPAPAQNARPLTPANPPPANAQTVGVNPAPPTGANRPIVHPGAPASIIPF